MVSVYTVGDLCKKCYSCVRECPTKAIEVHAGQADIIESLCISCGRCVLTCTQNAKRIRSSTAAVQGLLTERQAGGRPVYALLAPSFPAAFLDVEPERLVGAIRALGFDGVFEVAFGADLVSYEYYRRFRELERDSSGRFLISSPCPAVVSYVEKVFPELVPHLAEVVSPMEAMARVVRRGGEGAPCRVVFIGPCVAKKDEQRRLEVVDEVLPVDLDIVLRAREIVLGHTELTARDAIHVAVMQTHGIVEIMSFDRHFDGLPGVIRLH